jgi:hypothetical protein
MAITKPTLLPELYLPSRVNQHWLESGMDSLELCQDREHYLSYPHKVEYHYNSRGFRDAEWPDDLSNVIWCIGDSYTVGLGSPREHTWPYMLQQRLVRRTINVSLDGASNNWIARIGSAILTEFPNANIVTHWSFLHRRELGVEEIKQLHNSPDCQVASEKRRLEQINSTTEEDIVNTRLCIQQLQGNIVHSAIPSWAPADANLDCDNVIQTEQLDYARDGFHYDILTSNALVCEIIPALASNARC